MMPDQDDDNGRDLFTAMLAYHPRLRAAFDSLELFQRAEQMRAMSVPPMLDGDGWKNNYDAADRKELSAKEQQLKDARLTLIASYVSGEKPELDMFLRTTFVTQARYENDYEEDSGDDGDDGAALRPQPSKDGTHG